MATRISRQSRYSESSIKVLKGLEPVRQRPGMYTRTETPLHIIQEVIDNSADEALGGHARCIDLTLFKDGSIAVEDDGRGIPVGLHPEEQVPVVESSSPGCMPAASSTRKRAAPTAFPVAFTASASP
jgi:topoisomerase-4 subunit B